MNNSEIFQTLPIDARNQVSQALKAYPEVYFLVRGGEFKVQAHTVISASDDGFRKLVTFSKDDIFTEAEQVINYVNSFRSFPVSYRGVKNWEELSSDWKEAVYDENGNIKFK